MEKILLDVGGTFIKCFDGREIPIDSNGTRDEIVAAFRTAIFGNASGEKRDVQIRAAMPGPFDYATGQFLMTHKYAAVYEEYFADLVGLPRENCKFSHDVNCMLFGEISSDPGDTPNTALIAIGTGLGFAMCIDGEILKNQLGSPAVSIFKTPFRDGMLEDYASKRGVLKLYSLATGKPVEDGLTVKQIAERAHAGEQSAQDAFSGMGAIIGEAIAPIMREYGVKRILLGGQISRSHDLFEGSLRKALGNDSGVREIRVISSIDNATFNGLKSLK